MPPIGASIEAHAAAYASFTFTVPALSRVAIARPRRVSPVQTLKFSP
jgi:hypothetical protein